MPFCQRVGGDADCGAGVGVCVGEVQADGVGREDFGPDGDAAEVQPGEDDAEGGDEEEVEGWVFDQGFGKGEVGCSGCGGAEDGEDPEEEKDGPACETVGAFEDVVVGSAESGVRGDED